MFRYSKNKDISKKTRYRTLFGESVGRKTLGSLMETRSVAINIPVAAGAAVVAAVAKMPSELIILPLAFAFEHAVIGRFVDSKIRKHFFDGACVDTTPDADEIDRTQEEYGDAIKKARRLILSALPVCALVPAVAAFSMPESKEQDMLLFLSIAHGLAMTLSTYIILYNLQKVMDEKWALSDISEHAFDIEEDFVDHLVIA